MLMVVEEKKKVNTEKKRHAQGTLLGVKKEPADDDDDASAEPKAASTGALAVGIIGNRIDDEQEQPTETPSYTGGGAEDENASTTSDALLQATENDNEEIQKEATKDPYQSIGSEEEDVGQQPASTPWQRRLRKQFKSRMQNFDEDVTPPPHLPLERAMLQIPKSESSEDDEARKKKRCFLLWVSKNY